MTEHAKTKALQDVLQEMKNQDDKWGADRDQHPFLWQVILGEEYGEVCQAMLHDEFGGSHAGTAREELVQVAAVALQIIEQYDRLSKKKESDKAKGCLLGLAIGDALGTTLEFHERDSATVTDIVGGGPFQLDPGQWTDDTSMALCLGYSLLENKGFNSQDQLDSYYSWYRTGYMSSTGCCFDIGTTTRNALNEFKKTGSLINNTHFFDAGNGSLMRLAPIPIFYCTEETVSEDFVNLIDYSALSSKTTHANEVPVQCCIAFSIMINRALNGYEKDDILKFNNEILSTFGVTDELVQNVVCYDYIGRSRDTIKSTGYVIDSLEAALWAFTNTDSFEDAVLLAANLGDDADTVAAITGQLAGAYYGIDNIPEKWIKIITKSDQIIKLAEDLYNYNK